MQGKVVREMWNKVAWWHYETNCATCNARITTDDARYFCKDCKYSVCTACSSTMLARNAPVAGVGKTSAFFAPPTAKPSQVQPGDIFLCGPDRWGIHHVIMSIGQMKRDPQAAQWIWGEMHEVRGFDIFSCETIESSGHLHGKDVVWYVSKNFFARDSATGEAVQVADMARDSGTLEFQAEPVKVKMLMHPLRPGHGGPTFDAQAFGKALEVSATNSKKWSLKTAVKGMMHRRDCEALDPVKYSTPQSRVALLDDLEKRWELRPICTSVAIMVWQRYFKLVSGHGPEAADVAAQHILRWMPLLSDKTLPSALIKELSKCGWVLRGNLDT